MELDADVLLTGKDYENFRTIFEGFTSHQQRLMVKTYEHYDPDKEKEQEQENQTT